MKRTSLTISILVIVGLFVAVQSLLGNIAAEQLKAWLGPWMPYVPYAFVVITIGLIGFTVRDQLGKPTPGASESTINTEQASRNRRAMLENVWRTWIEGVLQDSLYKETLIALDMQSRPDAVKPPRNAVIQRPQQADQTLTPETSIIQVFDNAQGALLILGAPGSGKTTLLLELARDLIERAGRDTNYPIPVMFPLSTWAVSRRPLAEWLVDELVSRYTVPQKVAQAWITTDSVLPLLDGLDEVAPTARDGCVEAINAFHAARGQLPIAVCSRIADYEELAIKLRLHEAIVVQPLSREQVREYVRKIGLSVTPSDTSPLWDLLTTPLMLNVATLAYVGRPGGIPHTTGGVADRQEHLIGAYVERRLFEADPKSRYSAEQTQHYLRWLAWQMQTHSQTAFYVERMQPDWLPQRQYWVLKLGAGLMWGLLGGLAGGLAWGLAWGLVWGLVCGLVVELVLMHEIELTERVRWSWSETGGGLLYGLLYGLVIALVFGLVDGLIGGLEDGLQDVLNYLLVGGLVFGSLFAMLDGLSGVEVEHRTKPNQGIQRSVRFALFVGLVFGLVWGLVFGLLFGLLNGLMWGLVFGLLFGMIYGGDAWLRHHLIRLLFVGRGVMPWRYVQFLEYAASLVLLRKVGGGYIFIHRLLLDYFAKQYTGPETVEQGLQSTDS